MRFQFVATQAGSEDEGEFIVAQVACHENYLTFQRCLPFGSDEDWGIHVEFDDQINSGYEKVARCTLSRKCLQVAFTEPIDWQKKYTEVEIELQLTDADFESFAFGLQRVFSDREELLSVES
jgi:hypothetical protein